MKTPDSTAPDSTIFVTRTRGPFWSHRPAPVLLGAVIGTQLLATLITVYGLFMNPIGWRWALLVWGYALAWFLVSFCFWGFNSSKLHVVALALGFLAGLERETAGVERKIHVLAGVRTYTLISLYGFGCVWLFRI